MTDSLSESSPPAAEPILKAAAKTHLKTGASSEDALIDALIVSARMHVETVMNRALIDQTWLWKLDDLPFSSGKPLFVPKPPLQSITSITYVDTAGTTQTWDSTKYDVDAPSGPMAANGRIMPAFAESWPTTREQMAAVTITFVCGYGAAGSNVPDGILQAMLLLIGHWYENRMAVNAKEKLTEIPFGASSLLGPFRTRQF